MTTWRKPTDVITRMQTLERGKREGAFDTDYDPDQRPTAVTGVTLDFRVREIRGEIDYDGIVDWIALGPDSNYCAADIAWYEIQMQGCNSAGVAKPDSRLKDIYIVKNETDLDPDELKAIFERVKHPKRWYQKARVRVIDKDGREGVWSDWTVPVLPRRAARPGPPAPSNIVLSFDKMNGVGSQKACWRGRVKFDEIDFWDVPPTADRGKVSVNLSGALTAGATTLTLGTSDLPAPVAGERISVTIRPGGDNAEVVSYSGKNVNQITGVRRGLEGTTAIAHPDGANVVLAAADQQDRQNDLRGYDVQFRRCTVDGSGNFIAWVKDENDDYVQRTDNISWKKEDNDNGNRAVAEFPRLLKRHWWRARARTRAKYNLIGDWSDWTAPGSPSDNTAPPACMSIGMEVDPRRITLAAIVPSDTTDSTQMHEDISHLHYQVSDRADFNQNLSGFWREDVKHPSAHKSFRKKKTERGPFHARVRTVDGSNNKSAWVSTNKQRKTPGKVRNRQVLGRTRSVVVKYDAPNAWSDGSTDEWMVDEVGHYEIDLYRDAGAGPYLYDQDLQVKSLRKSFPVPKSDASGSWSSVIRSVGREGDFVTPDAATGSAVPEAAGAESFGELSGSISKSQMGVLGIARYQSSAPSPAVAGDVWMDTNFTPPRVKHYNGSSWNESSVDVAANSVIASSITAGAINGHTISGVTYYAGTYGYARIRITGGSQAAEAIDWLSANDSTVNASLSRSFGTFGLYHWVNGAMEIGNYNGGNTLIINPAGDITLSAGEINLSSNVVDVSGALDAGGRLKGDKVVVGTSSTAPDTGFVAIYKDANTLKAKDPAGVVRTLCTF